MNYTVGLSYQNLANRPGTVDAAGEASDFGADLGDVQAFLRKYPDAGNVNGDPEKAAARFLINGGIPVSENTELYGNFAYVYKKVNSFANYRTPYWRGPADNGLLAIKLHKRRLTGHECQRTKAPSLRPAILLKALRLRRRRPQGDDHRAAPRRSCREAQIDQSHRL